MTSSSTSSSSSSLELAPLRSLDDFILGKARFQVPNVKDEDRWFHRVINNLLYYQTNYLASAALLFALVSFAHPRDMAFGILVMTTVFGLAFYVQKQKAEVQQFKRSHPLIFASLLFASGYVLVYQLGCIVVFMLGICLPIVFIFVHASLRLRNVKNKLANATEALGLAKVTPMSVFLAELGIEPEFKIN